MRILIIEDNENVIANLRRGLRDSYVIDVARNGNEGLDNIAACDYDLIFLDLTLPDHGGINLCRELRRDGVVCPIMAATERNDIELQVMVLDAGADDYVTKPFHIDEIRARIRALLRRGTDHKSSELTAGQLVMDVAKRTVSRGGKLIQLRRKEFDLLEYLVRNNGHTVTRQMILDHVWDMNDSIWTNAIDVHIKHLRDKIDRPFDSHYIKTMHGIGYRLEVGVTPNEASPKLELATN